MRQKRVHFVPCRIILMCAMLVATVSSMVGQVVISQVYGGGGNTGSTYRNDFVELFNRGTVAVSVEGWSVQYASAQSSSWTVTVLHGLVQPGTWYLIQEAKGSAGTTDLPLPDASGTINISGTSGKVALLDTARALTDSVAVGPRVKDMLGWGNANGCEGSAPAPATTSKTAVARLDSGNVDTDDNLRDFAVRSPNPRNSSSLPLPIQLVHLGATSGDQGTVVVAWTTASEVNNYGFYVERKDLHDSLFQLLVGSFRPGSGTSVVPHDYEFVDSAASSAGESTYRLRQVDLGGDVHYSDPVAVTGTTATGQEAGSSCEISLAQNWPNPCNPSTTIAYNIAEGRQKAVGSKQKDGAGVQVKIVVCDLLGREVAVLVDGHQMPGERRVVFNGSTLASGVYFYRLIAKGQTLTRRLVLLR